MKSLVAMTYYQLMHSIALALTFDEKPNLYFSMSYINLSDEVLERIEDTGVFNKVIGITRRGDHVPCLRELRKTIDMDESEIDALGSSLFDEYLIPHYAELFTDADPDDEIYVYNDFQWHYYYICKHFENIIGVEDGYGSLLQQVSIHRLRGDAALIEPFVEKGYYPQPLYRYEKVKKIISSIYIDELDDYYKSKLEVRDFKDIVEENPEKFRDALLYIFDVGRFNIQDNSSLVIGQPLDRAKYCTYLQSYLLNKKIINNEIEQGYHVILKPHPAEKNNWMIYGNDNVTVLPKDFPIEVLNYQGKRFARVVTFSSTGASIISCGDEYYRYFDKTDTTPEEVKAFIKSETDNEKLTVDFYIKVREMSPETYINIYSCIFNYKYFHTNLHLLITDGNEEEYRAYYDQSHLAERIHEYRAKKRGTKERDLWHLELNRIKLWLERYKPTIDLTKVSSFDDWDIFREAIAGHSDYDYMMLIESKEPQFRLTEKIYDSLTRHMSVGMCFPCHSEKVTTRNRNKMVTVSPGFVGSDFRGDLCNKLWHRELIMDFIRRGNISEIGFAETVYDYKGNVGRKQGVSLYINPETYLSIEEGRDHFAEKILTLINRYTDEDDFNFLAGQIANVFYEYYDWSVIADGRVFAYSVIDELEDIIEDASLKSEVYKKMMLSVLYEKSLLDNNKMIQENNFYMGLKTSVDKAAKYGVLSGVDNLSRIRKKIKSVIGKK